MQQKISKLILKSSMEAPTVDDENTGCSVSGSIDCDTAESDGLEAVRDEDVTLLKTKGDDEFTTLLRSPKLASYSSKRRKTQAPDARQASREEDAGSVAKNGIAVEPDSEILATMKEQIVVSQLKNMCVEANPNQTVSQVELVIQAPATRIVQTCNFSKRKRTLI